MTDTLLCSQFASNRREPDGDKVCGGLPRDKDGACDGSDIDGSASPGQSGSLCCVLSVPTVRKNDPPPVPRCAVL